MTIVLPHTGLRVPHGRLTVTSLKEFETADDITFKATLRLDKKRVGEINNHGHNGDTQYSPDAGSAFGIPELRAYVAECLPKSGLTILLEENVLADLVEEYDYAQHIKRAAAKGGTVVRLLDLEIIGYKLTHWTTRTMLTTEQERTQMTTHLLKDETVVACGGLLQYWDGERWTLLARVEAPIKPAPVA